MCASVKAALGTLKDDKARSAASCRLAGHLPVGPGGPADQLPPVAIAHSRLASRNFQPVCPTSPTARHAFSAEQFHARIWPNNAMSLSRIEWL
jgi:hypothetical protein